MPQPSPDPTSILLEHTRGDPSAAERLLPLVYKELRALASQFMQDERRSHTLEPTALIHEAYLRLVDRTKVNWQGRAHFLALAAQAMRRVLVDHARRKKALKRGGGARPVTLTGLDEGAEAPVLDILALDEALEKLAGLNARHGQVVMLRFFAGLSGKETAHVLGVTERTVKNDWSMARAWLLRELDG